MNDILKMLEILDKKLAAILVSGDSVLLMADARKNLMDIYKSVAHLMEDTHGE